MTQLQVLTISAITSIMILTASIASSLAPAGQASADLSIGSSDATIYQQAVPGPAKHGGGGSGRALKK